MTHPLIDARKIKGLQTQINALSSDADLLRIEIKTKKQELAQKDEHIRQLKKQIETLQHNNNLKVSEHAIVRYFERIKGFDISEIEREIITDEISKMVETLGGTGHYPNGEFSVVMKNFTVVSIVK